MVVFRFWKVPFSVGKIKRSELRDPKYQYFRVGFFDMIYSRTALSMLDNLSSVISLYCKKWLTELQGVPDAQLWRLRIPYQHVWVLQPLPDSDFLDSIVGFKSGQRLGRVDSCFFPILSVVRLDQNGGFQFSCSQLSCLTLCWTRQTARRWALCAPVSNCAFQMQAECWPTAN